MSATERGQATHGRHSADVLREQTQQLPPVNVRRDVGTPPFSPRSTTNTLWDQITRPLRTVPRPRSEETGVSSPGELMDAALDGARTFQRFLTVTSQSDRVSLASRLAPEENPTLSDEMFIWGANSARLGVTPDDLIAIANKLANHPELIPGFNRAFKEEDIERALRELPWELIRQIS